MKHREREVRRCAREVLSELGLRDPPIDPEWIARGVGLQVSERALSSGVYGAMWKRGNCFGIIVSPSCPTIGHRRFSVAHELGHYHVDGHVEAMFTPGTETVQSVGGLFRDRKDRYEREADWFASELLVPTALCVSRIRERDAGIERIRALADEFETSLSMMAIRYAEVTTRAVASILSREGQIEWAAFSARIREHGWSWGLRKRDLVPPNTATSRLGGGPAGRLIGVTGSDSGLACEWFEGAPPDLELEEDVAGLGSFGRLLTILLIPDLPDPEELAMASDGVEPQDWRDSLRGYRMG